MTCSCGFERLPYQRNPFSSHCFRQALSEGTSFDLARANPLSATKLCVKLISVAVSLPMRWKSMFRIQASCVINSCASSSHAHHEHCDCHNDSASLSRKRCTSVSNSHSSNMEILQPTLQLSEKYTCAI